MRQRTPKSCLNYDDTIEVGNLSIHPSKSPLHLLFSPIYLNIFLLPFSQTQKKKKKKNYKLA